MGGDLGQSSNTGHVTKEGAKAPQDVFVHKEEIVHLILLHCLVNKHLWEIIFALMGFKWVFPKTVKEAIINWGVPLLGKKRERVGNQFRCAYFGQFRLRETV